MMARRAARASRPARAAARIVSGATGGPSGWTAGSTRLGAVPRDQVLGDDLVDVPNLCTMLSGGSPCSTRGSDDCNRSSDLTSARRARGPDTPLTGDHSGLGTGARDGSIGAVTGRGAALRVVQRLSREKDDLNAQWATAIRLARRTAHRCARSQRLQV